MLIPLDGKTLEPALIEVPVADRIVGHSPPHGMGMGEPSEEGCHLSLVARPDNKMPVVVHQTIAEDAKGVAFVRLQQHAVKRIEILCRAEELKSTGRAIEHVVNDATWG